MINPVAFVVLEDTVLCPIPGICAFGIFHETLSGTDFGDKRVYFASQVFRRC